MCLVVLTLPKLQLAVSIKFRRRYLEDQLIGTVTLIYIINSVDKPNFRVSLPHRPSTTVSLETNPVYSFGI